MVISTLVESKGTAKFSLSQSNLNKLYLNYFDIFVTLPVSNLRQGYEKEASSIDAPDLINLN